MTDEDKSKEELSRELAALRQRVAELETRLGRDVTERRQAEQALRASEEQYRLLAESITDVVSLHDRNGKFLYVSPSVQRLIGWRVEDLTGSNSANLVHPDDREQVAHAIVSKTKQGANPVIQWRCRRPDGTYIWLETIIHVLYDNGGRSFRLACSSRDITERLRTEEILRYRNQELALLNRVGQAFTSTLDLNQLLTLVLEEVRRLLGVVACSIWLSDTTSDELVCRQVTDAQSSVLLGWRLAVGQGVAGWVFQHRQSVIVPDTRMDKRHFKGVDRRTGLEIRSILAIPLQVKDEPIGVLQVVDTAVDRFEYTNLLLLESLSATATVAIENAHLYKQARQDAETKAILLHEVNHRVKNNLSAIIGLLYAEKRHAGIADHAAYQDIMKDLINRIQGLAMVHQLLSAAQWTPLPLEVLVTQIIDAAIRVLPLTKQLAVQVNACPVLITPKQANHLTLVINELVTNSIKYALDERPQAAVTVYITREDELACLEFRDDGPGYPEETLTLAQYNVGLYLVQTIVQNDLRGQLTLGNDGGAVAIIRFRIAT